jgi:hypothetical protein
MMLTKVIAAPFFHCRNGLVDKSTGIMVLSIYFVRVRTVHLLAIRVRERVQYAPLTFSAQLFNCHITKVDDSAVMRQQFEYLPEWIENCRDKDVGDDSNCDNV